MRMHFAIHTCVHAAFKCGFTSQRRQWLSYASWSWLKQADVLSLSIDEVWPLGCILLHLACVWQWWSCLDQHRWQSCCSAVGICSMAHWGVMIDLCTGSRLPSRVWHQLCSVWLEWNASCQHDPKWQDLCHVRLTTSLFTCKHVHGHLALSKPCCAWYWRWASYTLALVETSKDLTISCHAKKLLQVLSSSLKSSVLVPEFAWKSPGYILFILNCALCSFGERILLHKASPSSIGQRRVTIMCLGVLQPKPPLAGLMLYILLITSSTCWLQAKACSNHLISQNRHQSRARDNLAWTAVLHWQSAE